MRQMGHPSLGSNTSATELTATIFKDDAATPNWLKRGVFSSEDNAVTWLSAQISGS